VARKRVQDAETAIRRELDDMRNAGMVGSTSKQVVKTFEEMTNAIGDSLSDLQGLTKRRMGIMRLMMKLLSWARRATMTNPAG